MVTLVWEGGRGVWGRGPPPPWVLIILKKPWGGVRLRLRGGGGVKGGRFCTARTQRPTVS